MPLRGARIGVLFNSERTDTTNQMGALTKAASDAAKVPGAPKYRLVPRDINGPDSLDDLFDLFKGDIHALIVAAHPWFNNHRQDVVNGVTAGNFPAIFQWR